MTESALAYVPEDRRLALARGVDLPRRSTGSALFADISGFTPLTEALVRAVFDLDARVIEDPVAGTPLVIGSMRTCWKASVW